MRRRGSIVRFRSRTLSSLTSLVRKEGPLRLYEGIEAKALQSLVGSFVYFYAYSSIKVKRCSLVAGSVCTGCNVLLRGESVDEVETCCCCSFSLPLLLFNQDGSRGQNLVEMASSLS